MRRSNLQLVAPRTTEPQQTTISEAEDAFKSESKLYKLAKIGHLSATSAALSIAARSRQHQQVAASKKKNAAPRNATKVKGRIRRRNATAVAACRANNHDYSTIPPVFV